MVVGTVEPGPKSSAGSLLDNSLLTKSILPVAFAWGECNVKLTLICLIIKEAGGQAWVSKTCNVSNILLYSVSIVESTMARAGEKLLK